MARKTPIRKRTSRHFTYGRMVVAMFFVAAFSVWVMTSLFFAAATQAPTSLSTLAANGRLAAAEAYGELNLSLRQRFSVEETNPKVTLRPWMQRLTDTPEDIPAPAPSSMVSVVDGPSSWVRSVNRISPGDVVTETAIETDYPRLPLE